MLDSRISSKYGRYLRFSRCFEMLCKVGMGLNDFNNLDYTGLERFFVLGFLGDYNKWSGFVVFGVF